MAEKDDDLRESLQRLETVVCDSLREWRAGVCDPYERRLCNDKGEVAESLKRLSRNLGVRYSGATLSGFTVYDQRQNAVLSRLIHFAQSMVDCLRHSGGLLLFGPPGTGKDHLLAALLKIAVAKHHLDVEWFDGGDLFDEFYFAIKSDSESTLRELQTRLRKPHVLAISDPQPPQGPLSDSQIRRLRDLIDARYRSGLSTWITTNIDRRPEAVAILTEPVLQRLKEGSAIIDCNWASFRERKTAAW